VGEDASLTGDALILDGNGFAYLSHGAEVPI